jgi:Peptidase family C69
VCDSVVALPIATGSSTLFAKNSDRPVGESTVLEFHSALSARGERTCTYINVAAEPDETFAVLGSRPTWGWGFEHGVNEVGLAVGNHRITTTKDPRPYPDALTGMDLVRLTLERAPDAAAGVSILTELLEYYDQGGSCFDIATHGRKPYWSSFLLADPEEAWVVETSGDEWMADQVDRTYAMSNRTTIPAFDQLHRHFDAPVEKLVDPRLMEANRMLAEHRVNRDTFTQLLRSHVGNDGWSICMHTGDAASTPMITTASMIAELPLGRLPRVWVTDGSPCQHQHREIGFGPLVPSQKAWQDL